MSVGLNEGRAKILEKYGPYVRSLAATVRKQFHGAVEMDELVAYGQIGLLEAAERYDPKVGANFLTFAHYRIKGAIFDGMRKMGILKGPEARSAERINAYLGNLNATSSTGPTKSADDEVRDITAAVTGLAMVFATSYDSAEGPQIADTSMNAEERLELEQLKVRVKEALKHLPENQRKLLEGYYFENKTLEDAGAGIGQSKSWASRLHARAIDSLKQLLEEREDTFEVTPPRSSHGRPTGRHSSSASRPIGGSGPGGAGGKERPE